MGFTFPRAPLCWFCKQPNHFVPQPDSTKRHKKHPTPKRVELLPYHALGEQKYAAIGKEVQTFSVPSEEKMKEFKQIFA